jgi:hypothetical protein
MAESIMDRLLVKKQRVLARVFHYWKQLEKKRKRQWKRLSKKGLGASAADAIVED